MARKRAQTRMLCGLWLACFCALPLLAQESAPNPLNTSGQITVDGHVASYLIRHLPLNAYPQLPLAIQAALTRRGCLIPQSYEARQPENVVHASLDRPGSSDWAVLCSVKGTVSLLVFFGDTSSGPVMLASAPETERLQSHGASAMLGFNWAIDAASPEQIREAQLGMRHRPARLDHDALADSIIDLRTVYHFYSNNTWGLLDTQD